MRAGSFSSFAPSHASNGGEFAHSGMAWPIRPIGSIAAGMAASMAMDTADTATGAIRQLLWPRLLWRLRRLGLGRFLALVWRMGLGLGLGLPV